ncbi:MAG: ORF6N domain-containing protein [Deltaproteobacteria bacterium]|nr:ORF6N domain-containing protein [Deltaproteobacteria bacterium]
MVDYTTVDITTLIVIVRGKRVMLDRDLAGLYGTTTKRLNEQVKRNRNRFPDDFMFQLTAKEWADLTSQIARSNAQSNRSQFATGSQRHRDPRFTPYAFTEHGALMAANILRSERAIQMSVFVVRAFIRMRQMLIEQRGLARKLAELEEELTARLDVHETAINEILGQIRRLLSSPPEPERPKKRIGFLVEEPHVPYKSPKGFKKQKRQ